MAQPSCLFLMLALLPGNDQGTALHVACFASLCFTTTHHNLKNYLPMCSLAELNKEALKPPAFPTIPETERKAHGQDRAPGLHNLKNYLPMCSLAELNKEALKPPAFPTIPETERKAHGQDRAPGLQSH
ncbi:hypothetical protein P7K49_036791 [Saguinus oedipus]|uniref:Uncharacterized protein n=1 Tax=Saguinus oedipus TaxID=9490 RepID=A0ABQ9TLD7_SAGOE|nr:hypothetical protein P7K49_036791 [Saguinus oedipus]